MPRTGIAFYVLRVALFLVGVLVTGPFATTAFATSEVCTGLDLSGKAFGTCRAYCDALRCDENSPATDRACRRLGKKLLAGAAAQGINLAVVDGVVQCGIDGSISDLEPIPSDANEWVCNDPRPKPTPGEIANWCAANIDQLGTPLPLNLRYPPPLNDLEAKVDYDERLKIWLEAQAYVTEHHWKTDTEWRFTGPITGSTEKDQFGNDTINNYGTHFPVKLPIRPRSSSGCAPIAATSCPTARPSSNPCG